MVNTFSKKISLNKKRGLSTIIGGIIFLVLLTAGFSAFFVAMDVQSDTIYAQRTVSNSLMEKTQEDFEIEVTSDDSTGYQLEIEVKNKGPNPIEISNIWIINKSAVNEPATSYDVNYGDAFIPPGNDVQILETTPILMRTGEHDIKVVSVLGTIQTEKKIDPSNPGFGGEGESTGDVFMDFRGFESCEPAVDDCTSNSPDWNSGWKVDEDTEYIWRITIASRADDDIILDENTTLLMLRAQTTGGGNMPRAFYLKADSTPANEDPGAYTPNNSKTILKDGTPVSLYFGVIDPGGAALQKTHNSDDIVAVFMLVFGHEDVDENGYNVGDPPYSQNLPFQALKLN